MAIPNTTVILDEENIVLSDIKTKLLIARNVVHACVNGVDTDRQIDSSNLCDRLKFYAGVSEEVAIKILNSSSNAFADRTFRDWYNECKYEHSESQREFSERLREAIVDHYVYKRTIPTFSSLAKCFDVNATEIRKRLHSVGYLWKRVPGTTKAILVEKPDQMYRRQIYLELIKKCREDEMHIIYLDEKFINIDGRITDYLNPEEESVSCFCMAVSRPLGIISHALMKNVSVQEFKSILEEWIMYLVQSTGINCAFVFEEKSHHNKSIITVPTIHSSGAEMAKWLEFHNIPYNPDWHRSELFNLIISSKKHFPHTIYKLDEFLQNKGHKVIRRPQELNDLDYFKSFWKHINVKEFNVQDLETEIASIMTSDIFRNWAGLETLLIKKENKTYKEDIEVETAIDKLLTLAKYDESSRSRFDNCEDEIDETKLSEIILM